MIQQTDPRFMGIRPFKTRVWLSSPTMHDDAERWVVEAIQTNWVSTVGANINEVERMTAEKIGRKYCVALSAGTAALHLAIKIAAERIYGQPKTGHGALEGKKVFCSDMTFAATVNPVAYENGEAVFIDTERDTWNMDPVALEKAFDIYPDVRIVVIAHLYGVPAKMDELMKVCRAHNAVVIEDAAESFCSTYKGIQTGSFGDAGIVSWNGNKLITGSSGGMFLTDDKEWADKVRKLSTQSREDAPWYQHEEIGYNYRMSNLIAGVVRSQLPYAEQHSAQKKAVWERYRDGLADLPVRMNPYDEKNSKPNFWLSCMTINDEAMCKVSYGDMRAQYETESGKSCPTEILEAMSAFNAEGRPIWKPMHMQPIYRDNPFVKAGDTDVGGDIFRRGLCLPSDNKMTKEQQDVIIEIIHRCFR